MNIYRVNKTIPFLGLAMAILFQLISTHAHAQVSETRIYELEGARNFRDFGGYSTGDGQRVKWGLLYRSNQPAGMTVQDYRRIAPLAVATVVDFRTMAELKTAPTQWQGRPLPQFVHLPMGETERLKELDPLVEAAVAAEDVQRLREVGMETYRRVPTEYAAEYGQLLNSLAEPQTLPVVIHCHAGKDRTGIGAALILSLLRVPRETIMADYLLSNDLLLSDDDGRSAVEKLYWGVEREWLEATFESIEAHYGSVDRYIEVGLGIDADTRKKIRSNLLTAKDANR